MKKRNILTTIAILAFATCALQGETIVNWGGSGTATADVDFNLPTPTDNATTGTRTWEYSATTPVLATGGAYTGPDLYGSMQTENATDGPTDFTSAGVTSSGQIVWTLDSTANGDIIRGLAFIKKSDFSSLSSDTIKFDATSSATIGCKWLGGAGGNRGVRLAVLDGSSWYLSRTVFGGFKGNLVISDLSAEMFGSYDPTGAPLDDIPTSFTMAGSSFSDIQAVGAFMGLGTPTATKASGRITGMEVSAAIPEPATLGLVGMTGMLLIVFRRRMFR